MNIICNPITPIPMHKDSHVHGWAQYWARILEGQIVRGNLSSIKRTDTFFWEHGVNFGGSLNLFGGVDDELVARLTTLLRTKPALYSLDIAMPDYAGMLESRLGQASTSPFLTPKVIGDLRRYLKTAGTVTAVSLDVPSICIGDSHSTAFARANASVHRINGKTLYSTLEDPSFIYNAIALMKSQPRAKLRDVTLCFGSIDIRHHLMRLDSPRDILIGMVKRYVDLAKNLESRFKVRVELCAPVPVEYEGRKIPKTGYYKGEPFYGSLDNRKALTTLMIEELKKRWGASKVVQLPSAWYGMDPEKYAKEFMELSSSVHISPVHYRAYRTEKV